MHKLFRDLGSFNSWIEFLGIFFVFSNYVIKAYLLLGLNLVVLPESVARFRSFIHHADRVSLRLSSGL